MLPGTTVKTDEDMDLGRLLGLWRGDDDDPVGTAAVIGTAAIALRLMERADSPEDAEAQALALWQSRPGSPLEIVNAA